MLRRTLAALLLFPGVAIAQVAYTDAELQRVRERAVPSIRSVLEEDIVGNLPREARARAARIRLAFPEEGPGPLAFYAEPATGTIHMPLASIRFFDDMATVFAWFESRGCEPGYVQSYLWALLREGRPLPSPLRAFAIDREAAFADPYTFDLSGKIVSSGIQFILAHEVGHLLLDHAPGVAGEASRRQEAEADRFALDHFARLGGSPMGVFWYYMLAWWRDPVGDAARSAGTHPVSPERIAALARRLAEAPMDFAHAEADPEREAGLVGQLAAMTAELARMIDDDGMLTLMPLTLERDFPPSRLDRVCPSGG